MNIKKIDKIQEYTQNDAIAVVTKCNATNPTCQTEVEIRQINSTNNNIITCF